MKYFLTACYLVLGGLVVFAADAPRVDTAQVQRAMLQAEANGNGYPTLEKVQKMAQNHKGDLNSLAQTLLEAAKPSSMQYAYDGPYHDVHSIWYDGSTLLIVSLDTANSLRAEAYGPNVELYVPNYGRIGNYRGSIYIELPDLPSGSEGMDANQLMEIVSPKVPQAMTLIASLDQFPSYNLDEVLEIAENHVEGDPLRPLAAELIKGFSRVEPKHPIHSIWYKDGTLIVVEFPYSTHCTVNFYGAKRGKISRKLPRSVYADEADLRLAIAADTLPQEMVLIAIAGL